MASFDKKDAIFVCQIGILTILDGSRANNPVYTMAPAPLIAVVPQDRQSFLM